jgi:CheY-like chemotaxis protein
MDRIIVVDDDQAFCGLLKTVLEFESYQVTVEARPDALVPLIQHMDQKPALVLMDVHSGQGDTLGVLRELKTDEALKSIPVVMTSGMDRSAECMDAGADAFLLKPFHPDELITLVADIIGRS